MQIVLSLFPSYSVRLHMALFLFLMLVLFAKLCHFNGFSVSIKHRVMIPLQLGSSFAVSDCQFYRPRFHNQLSCSLWCQSCGFIDRTWDIQWFLRGLSERLLFVSDFLSDFLIYGWHEISWRIQIREKEVHIFYVLFSIERLYLWYGYNYIIFVFRWYLFYCDFVFLASFGLDHPQFLKLIRCFQWLWIRSRILFG
jgi:hypothetical protein